MSKSDFAKHMDTHWRYNFATKKFKWWFARQSWRQVKGKRKWHDDDGDKRFNKILRRHGLAHLQIIHLENRDDVLDAKRLFEMRSKEK